MPGLGLVLGGGAEFGNCIVPCWNDLSTAGPAGVGGGRRGGRVTGGPARADAPRNPINLYK